MVRLRDVRPRFAEKAKEEARRGLTEHGVQPMLVRPSMGLAAILPKTIKSCLSASTPLLFNWDDKLRGLILGICLSRSLILQSIAQTRPGRVKTAENMLSAFLARERLDLGEPGRACVIAALRGLGKRRFWRHHGKDTLDPMFLATTLTTESNADLTTIVRLYSWRWGIETFFWRFKNGLNAQSWRVFSCWEAIDRLLAAAHMAYLVLALLAELLRRAGRDDLRKMVRQLRELLRSRFARPPQLTLGRLFQIIAMDFPSPRLAGVNL